MKNKFIKLAIINIALLTLFSACHRKKKPEAKTETDSFHAGKALFGADESFRPIVDEEAFVFSGIFTQAKPIINYRPETQVLSQLLNDTVRFAILSRDLTASEKKLFNDKGAVLNINPFAHDAVVFIVNQSSADTLITVSQIKQMLNGKYNTNKSIVFDNPNSSTMRYLRELSGNRLTDLKNIYALKSNKDVIRYISEHPDAIGVVGFSWLDEPDADYAAAAAKVKIMSVKDEGNKKYATQYYQPSQTTLALKQYPLSRSLYVINATGRMGLGAGFENFLLGERGQRIVLKSGLLPESIPQREINVTKQVNNAN
ncbi:substrate-binding domain-containing protein [Mucilaginibacter koreensis]